MPDRLEEVIKRVVAGSCDEADIQAIAAALQSGQLSLVTGSRAAGIAGDATNAIVITGDNNLIVQGQVAESLQAILERFSLQKAAIASVDELVQQVRSRFHDDIQRLHGTIPLLGVDHWVPLGELFVDVNILEELSSSHRAELDDLWQDFSRNPSYRSLDRIGLGRERERVSGLKVLERNTNLVVVGKPGSGKTTYLQRVVTECNTGNLQAHKIPVLIKLREFVEDGRLLSYSLERYLEQYWQLSSETQSVLSQGRVLMLLDGLDEVTGEDGKTIIRQIKQFARIYPHVQIVVTCRTQSFSGEMDWKSLRFSFVEVADFNKAQVQSFGKHWFKTVVRDEAVGLAKAQKFLEQLFREENRPIRELAITPILLSLTCAVFHQTGKFYSKRSKLYEEGLELMLEQWDKSRSIERDEIYRDLSVERKLELLSYLAMKKFEQPQYVLFEQAEVEGYIAEFLQIGQRDSRAVLRAIEAQHGLLIERTYRIYSFSHLTFHEYFAARQIMSSSIPSEQKLAIQGLVVHLTDKRWREIFLLVVEMLPNSDYLLQLMKHQVEQLVSDEPFIQKILDWSYIKGLSVMKPYKPSSIRAFYVSLIFTFADTYHVGMIEIDNNFELSRTIDHNFIHVPYIYPYKDFANTIDSILAFDFALFYTYEHIRDLDITLDPDKGLTFDATNEALHKINNGIIDALDLAIAFNPSAKTHQVLRKLQSELSALSGDEKDLLIEWWRSNDKGWREQLFDIMIEQHLRIWIFHENTLRKLEQYYQANLLLARCFNSHCCVSDKVRQDIEDTMLLPMAEIEKRQRD